MRICFFNLKSMRTQLKQEYAESHSEKIQEENLKFWYLYEFCVKYSWLYFPQYFLVK